MPTLPLWIGHLIPKLIAICCFSPLPVQAPPQKGIHDAVELAITGKKYARSIPSTRQASPNNFSEVGADGGLLMGVQIALGRYNGENIIVGVKPVYTVSDGIWSSATRGIYERTRDFKSMPCAITEYVSLVAPPGSAVGKVHLSKDRFVYGISLEYLPIGTLSMEEEGETKSIWVGSEQGKKEVIDAHGMPVCGVCGGTTADGVLRDFGLIIITDPHLRPPSYSEDWDTEEFWNSLTEKKPEAKQKPKETSSTSIEQGSGQEETDNSWGYIPYLVFGGVAVPIMAVCYFLLGRHRSEDLPQVPVRLPGTPRQSLDVRASQGRFTLPEINLPALPDNTSGPSANASTPNGKSTRWM